MHLLSMTYLIDMDPNKDRDKYASSREYGLWEDAMLNRFTALASRTAVISLAAFAALSADAGGNGTDVVAMGGGYISEAQFALGDPHDITFSFFVGFDKHDRLDGAFQYKKVIPGEGNVVGVSTQIMDFKDGKDNCPWIQMDGSMKFHAPWQATPRKQSRVNYVEYFRLKVWDCEGLGLPDSIQIWVWRRDPNDPPSNGPGPRQGQWLDGRTELTGGNIMIR